MLLLATLRCIYLYLLDWAVTYKPYYSNKGWNQYNHENDFHWWNQVQSYRIIKHFIPKVNCILKIWKWLYVNKRCLGAGIIRNAGTFQGNTVIHIWKKNSYNPEPLSFASKIEIHVGNWTEAPSVKQLSGFTWFVVDKTIFIFKKFWNKIVVCHVDYGILFQ